jgi:F-type H+-transporting ATPase subunit delta
MHNSQIYAKTLFDLCSKNNHVVLMKDQLKSIVYLYNKVPAFRLVLITKRINNKDKVNIISKALNKFDLLLVEFLSIIIENNQIGNLVDIIKRFDTLANKSGIINTVEITSAHQLDDQEFQSISNALNEKLDFTPEINQVVDSSILGGLKLRIGNNIFDNSVYYQINQLKKTLHNM